MAGKQPRRVQAPSLLSYRAVRALGMTTTSIARHLSMTQPAVSISVQRGERLVKGKNGQKEKLLNEKL